MPITLSPLEPSQVHERVRVELAAFKSHPRMPILFPGGYTDDLYAYYESGMFKGLSDPQTKFRNAIDDDTGEILGGSEWTFALDPAKNAAVEPTAKDVAPPDNWPEGGNWAIRRFFTRNLEQLLKDDLGGRGYIMLNILVVNPKHQGRGIGAKLLEWGVQQADELSVPMCLESTPAGLSLYKRFGFTVQRFIKADMKQFGWDQPYDEEASKRVWMIREPQPKACFMNELRP